MKALLIASISLRRLLRDRTAGFFVFALPFLIILAVGATFGGEATPELGLVAESRGRLARELVAGLERSPSMEVVVHPNVESLDDAVSRQQVDAAVVIPADYDAVVLSGGTAKVTFLARRDAAGQDLRISVSAAVAQQSAAVRAARFAAAEGRGSFDDLFTHVRSLASRSAAVTVSVSVPGGAVREGRFDLGAAQQLILFIFTTSMAAAGQLIDERRVGISRRMMATPTPVSQIVGGAGTGRLAVAIFQALVIVFVSMVVFRVDFGDPAAAAAIVLLFAFVATGAAMLLGSALRSAQQATSLGVFLALGLAALGGCMVPLEVFPDSMRVAARFAPHGWAMQAFDDLLRRDAGLRDILPELGALAAFAAVLTVIAVRRFRRSITG